jgi:hypothetical protein
VNNESRAAVWAALAAMQTAATVNLIAVGVARGEPVPSILGMLVTAPLAGVNVVVAWSFARKVK